MHAHPLTANLSPYTCRHPASGYVQGINDLVTPFLAVFISDHFEGQPSMATWLLDDFGDDQVG